MAFNLENFDKLTQAGHPAMIKICGYYSTDAVATIVTANYFDSISRELNIGDYIFLRGNGVSGRYTVTTVSPHVTVTVLP